MNQIQNLFKILENDDTMGAEGEEEKNDSPLREQVNALFYACIH